MTPLHVFVLALLAGMPPQAGTAAKDPDLCISLLLPTVSGVDGDAVAVATSIRSLFESYLTGPSLKAMPLEARLPSQAAEEARQKGCLNMLTVAVTRKSSGGGHKIGALSQAAGTAAIFIPSAGMGGDIAKGAAIGGAEAASTIAYSTRAKDEITVAYRLGIAGSTSVLLDKSQSAKAKSDGEDLLTPLVAKASEAIAAAALKK